MSINYLLFEFHLLHAKADDVYYDDVSKGLSFTIVKLKVKNKMKKFICNIYPQCLSAIFIRNIYPQFLSAKFLRNFYPQNYPQFLSVKFIRKIYPQYLCAIFIRKIHPQVVSAIRTRIFYQTLMLFFYVSIVHFLIWSCSQNITKYKLDY